MNPKLNKLIIDLSRSIGLRSLYFSGHPFVRDNCLQIIDDLRSLLSELESESLFIGIVEGKLIHDGHYLVGPSIMGKQLVEFTKKLHCGGLVLGKDTTIKEIEVLLDLATEWKIPIGSLQEARALLKLRGVHNIELATHYTAPSALVSQEDKVVWHGKDSGGHLHSPLLVYQALFDVVAKAHGNVSLDRSIDINGAQSVSEHLLYSTRSNFTDMLQFVHYPDYDVYTVGHSVRVSTLAVFVGDHLGLDDEQLLDLGTAGLLHDVGKSKIPSEILFKPGRLNDEEFSTIRSHASLGAEILLEHKESTRMQVAAAWGHHIRYDGGGYPAPPPWAVRSHLVALLHICDVFEALTAVRPYKPQLTPLAAFSIMLQDKGAFDPALLHAFVSTLGIYPPGNRVRLADGSQGIVVVAGSSIDKPFVQITRDKTGTAIPANEQQVLDLAKDTSGTLEVTELLFEETP